MSRACNPWIARIAKTVGETDPELAIQGLVNRFRGPKQGLRSVVEQLGIRDVICEELPFDGGIYQSEGGRIIKLNSLSSEAKRRFTLAHEVGHLILECAVEGPASCVEDEGLERACDKIAAELVLPTSEVCSFASVLGKQSPEKLGHVATRFGVSLEAAARRLADLNLWRWPIGMWDCSAGGRQVWFVGKRPWKTDRPSFTVFDLALESGTPVCANEYFSTGAHSEPVALKAYHIGKNFVIAIAATSR